MQYCNSNYAKNLVKYNNCYSELTDEKLVEMYNDGNEKAVDCLIIRYYNIVKKVVASYYIMGADKDDLIQEALISFYKAVMEYNSTKHCAFKNYAYVCIKRHIITIIRNTNRLKHNPLNNYVSFNMLLYDEKEVFFIEKLSDNKSLDPESILIEKENIDYLFNYLYKRVSDLEKNVLLYYIDGMSYFEISDALDIDIKAVDNALQRVKKES
jgi:RNA polymerase sigma factor, sigma-70 family